LKKISARVWILYLSPCSPSSQAPRLTSGPGGPLTAILLAEGCLGCVFVKRLAAGRAHESLGIKRLLHSLGLLILSRYIQLLLGGYGLILEDELMHDIPCDIVDGMHVLVFEPTYHQVSVIRFEEDDIVYNMCRLKGIRDPFGTLLSILPLPAIGEMQLFGETEPLRRLEEELVLKHDVTELRLCLQQLKEFVECDRSVPMQVQLLDDVVPALFTLHHALSEFPE